MATDLTGFYDGLAEHYHLIFGDWDRAVARQADTLHRLIQSQLDAAPDALSLLDCSCGIGTQATGLSLLGYRVLGTDLSPKAVERAKIEAKRLGAHATFHVADLRTLSDEVQGTFDVVLTCDNAIPHLIEDADLLAAARNMRAVLRPKGLLVIGIRDYDRMLEEKPTTTPVVVAKGPEGRSLSFKVLNWSDDGRAYVFDLFVMHERHDGWETHHGQGEYRALRQGELTGILERAGFAEIAWHPPEETGYFQPLVTARAGR
jgi:SAM-dependent methyltransferase